MSTSDFALERRLYELDKDLHSRFSDTVFALQRILSNYKLIFPDFTDHTELHSLNIIDFCNRLIGDDITKLNKDEIYAILMGCYFHDTGMGISYEDYIEFSKSIDFKDYFDSHSRNNIPEIIRNFHNEYSALFLRKYAYFFEIPSKEHLFAIEQISRGHRKLDLLNEEEFPLSLKLDNGNTICLTYLSSLVRLADEIDVTASRNSSAIYDISLIVKEKDIIEFMKHDAIKDLIIEDDRFVMVIETKDEELYKKLETVRDKMKATLDICRQAVNERTPYKIRQQDIVIRRI